MNDVIITVRGSHERRATAELAMIRVVARNDGAERSHVVATTGTTAEIVQAALVSESPHDWSSTGLAVRAERPWNHEGKQLDLVHHASVTFTATFASVESLSRFAATVADTAGIEIAAVNWDLTPQSRARLEREVAAAAVTDAVTRAETYAAALGCSGVAAIEVADVGLLSNAEPSPGNPVAMRAMSAEMADITAVTEPEEITLRVEVEARFRAQ